MLCRQFIVRLACSTQQIQICNHQICRENHRITMSHCHGTRIEAAIVRITVALLIGLRLLQIVLQKIDQIIGIGKTFWRIGFPTGIRVIYGIRNKGYGTVVLNQLHIRPCTDKEHLCRLLLHVVNTILGCQGINLVQVKVTLVDHLIIGSTVQELVISIAQIGEVGYTGNRIARVLRCCCQVAADFSQDGVLFHHLLEIGHNSEIEIHGILSIEILGIAVHLRRQHVLAGRSHRAHSQESDEKSYD